LKEFILIYSILLIGAPVKLNPGRADLTTY